MNFETCFELLQSERKIDREKAKNFLEILIKEAQGDVLVFHISPHISKLKESNCLKWTTVYAMLVIIEEISKHRIELFDLDYLAELTLIQLEHPEYRVRIQAGEILGHLTPYASSNLCANIFAKLKNLINDHFYRDESNNHNSAKNGLEESQKIPLDAEGWKYLETSFKGLYFLIKGSITGKKLDISDVFPLLTMCTSHKNRFVRESVMQAFDVIFQSSVEFICPLINSPVIESLVKGLEDNWSQVRFAASVASRNVLQLFKNSRPDLTDCLLPRICLNRHYLAEGVKLYNVRTWELVTGGHGQDIVKKNLDNFVKFYVSQAEADNHAVREAACHCLAELSFVISDSLSDEHLSIILDCLVLCFNDESWPVRDTACSAAGIIVSKNSNYFSSKLEKIFPFFFRNLVDSIQSVRIGAAISFANVSNALPSQTFPAILSFLKEKFLSVKEQKYETDDHVGMSKKPAVFGVVSNIDNDHCDQVMYSCGSLAPRMSRTSKASGCSGHSFTRPSQPWEYTDGCICLCGELSRFYLLQRSSSVESHSNINESARSSAIELLNQNIVYFSEVFEFRNFKNHVYLLESFLKYFIDILKFLELDSRSDIIQLFVEPIHYSLTQQNSQNLSLIAQEFLKQSISLYGARSVRNWFENYFGILPPSLNSYFIN